MEPHDAQADVEGLVPTRVERKQAQEIRQRRGQGGGEQGDQAISPGQGEPMKKLKPLRVTFNPYAFLLMMTYMAATGFYFYIRATRTLVEGPTYWYGILILTVEGIGVTSMIPYALLLVISMLPKNKFGGLPAAKDVNQQDVSFGLHVRVLIPCYKEDIEVVGATVRAALEADLPPGTRRTVYLCDDGKDDTKKAMCETLGAECVYVTGRIRQQGEVNGKSNNLNNCLKNLIYDRYKLGPSEGSERDNVDHRLIPHTEVVVVFDADMVCNKNFFLRILEVMTDPKVALCLSPQAFHNINPAADLFNNINLQFWEYWLPGAVGWGYIACTGTNFCIRAGPLAHCGFFPTYTITEDYALGMELKMKGYRGTYMLDYIARGEAPDEIRNVMRQRSRWTKGHMQVFFSWDKCPLLLWRLSLPMKLWYTYGTWSYFCTIITVPAFLLVPFFSLFLGWNPLIINWWFAVAGSAYYGVIFLIQNYCRNLSHLKSLWFSNISNTVLWFTYVKAVMNVLLAKLGGQTIGFKVTEKKVVKDSPGVVTKVASVMKAMSKRLTQTFSRRRGSGLPVPTEDLDEAQDLRTGDYSDGRPPRPAGRQVRLAGYDQTPINLNININTGDEKKGKGEQQSMWSRFFSVFSPHNVGDLGGVLDPVALVLMFFFCLASFAMAIYRIVTDQTTSGWLPISPYVALPLLWAFYNAIPSYLFIHYCFTGGPSFQRACTFLHFMSSLISASALVLLWLSLPKEVNVRQGGMDVVSFMATQASAAQDFADQARLVVGLAADLVDARLGGVDVDVTGGWFTGGNSLKSVMPMTSAMTMMAWGLRNFSQGYTAGGAEQDTLRTLKLGADYVLNKLFISTDVSTHPMFIAQVGNPADYVTVGEPELSNRFWGRLSETETQPGNRMAWVLDKDHVGADLLSSASAALASVSLVFRERGEAGYADTLVDGAKKLYDFARMGTGRPKSYCEYVPCQTSITVKETVAVVPVDVNEEGNILCWTPDWSTSTCVFKRTSAECLQAQRAGRIYRRRTECCSELRSQGVYANQTTAQGACALPEGQYQCFIPNVVTRTCEEDTIDRVTGKGCTGVGLDVFSTSRSCCNHLAKSLIITEEKPGTGVCSLNLTNCFIPDFREGTCKPESGEACNSLTGSYATDLACCARLARDVPREMMSGICAVKPRFETCFVPDLSVGSCRAGSNISCLTLGDMAFATQEQCCIKVIRDMAGVRNVLGNCRGNVTETCFVKDLNGCVSRTGAECREQSFGTLRACCVDFVGVNRGGNRTGVVGCDLNGNDEAPHVAIPEDDNANDGNAGLFFGNNRGLKEWFSALTNRRLSMTFLENPAGSEFLADMSSVLNQRTTEVNKTVNVTFFKSHSVWDDLSWAAVWLHLATGEPAYLGDAQHHMQRHVEVEARAGGLANLPEYYIFNWNNHVWGAAMLLAEITDSPIYHEQSRVFLRTWVEMKPPKRNEAQVAAMAKAASEQRVSLLINQPLVTLDNQQYQVWQQCIPERNTSRAAAKEAKELAREQDPADRLALGVMDPLVKTHEDKCDDGIDNDCNGLIDDEDPSCPFFPVKYTKHFFAWTQGEPLPNAANAAFLSAIYAQMPSQQPSHLTTAMSRKLRCWTLGQVRYMLGDNGNTPDEDYSYVVGFGKRYPHRVQHQESSCPADPNVTCDWRTAFRPGTNNPRLELVRGALVAGPGFKETYIDDRTLSSSRVAVHYNAGLSAAIAALTQTKTDLTVCGQMHGVFQEVFGKENL